VLIKNGLNRAVNLSESNPLTPWPGCKVQFFEELHEQYIGSIFDDSVTQELDAGFEYTKTSGPDASS